MKHSTVTTCLLVLLIANVSSGEQLKDSLSSLNDVGNAGVRHSEAIKAWQQLSRADVGDLPEIIKGIDASKPLAANWIRAAVDQIAERSIANGRKLPNDALEKLIFDQTVAPRARRLAYEWLVRTDDTATDRIIPQMLNDTSLEMRRDAVEQQIEKAEASDSDVDKKKYYQTALTAARDKDQIDAAFDKLVELGEEVDLAKHFGFITSWKLIGPFDNTDKKGFPVAYPPETELNVEASYKGKKGDVKWFDHATTEKYGMVNLNEAVGKNMGAIAYAYAEFDSPKERTVDLRLGSICAAKLWLNGDELMEHEVYHSGTKIDQYVAKGKLKAGKNSILLKICQNEQTESWAQDWEFQFRVCDQVGTAIHSAKESK